MLCSILKKRWNSSVLRMSVDGKSHLFAVLRRVAGATGCGRIASLLQLIEAKCFRTVSIRKVPSPIIPYPVYTVGVSSAVQARQIITPSQWSISCWMICAVKPVNAAWRSRQRRSR